MMFSAKCRALAAASAVVLSLGLVVGLVAVAPAAPAQAAAKVKVVKRTASVKYAVAGHPRGVTVKVTKPVLSAGATAKIRSVFNSKINLVINKEVAAVKKLVAGKAKSVGGAVTVQTKAASVYQGRYVSVALDIWRNWTGNTSACRDRIVTYTYDTKTGRFLTLRSFADTNHNQLFWELMSDVADRYSDSDFNTSWWSPARYGDNNVFVEADYPNSLPKYWTVSAAGLTFWSARGDLLDTCSVGPVGFRISWNRILTPAAAKGTAKTYRVPFYICEVGARNGSATVKVTGKRVQVSGGYWGVRGTGGTGDWALVYSTSVEGSTMYRNVMSVDFASRAANAKPTGVFYPCT